MHQALHEHPLIEQLLTRPSLDAYRAVLQGFHGFYAQAEPWIVARARKLGFARQYPQASRTRWLLADLASLGCDNDQRESRSDDSRVARLDSIGDLVGYLYVIKGSALGGQTILRRISGALSVERACRFFHGDGGATRQTWNAFRRFCDSACRSDEARREAIVAAKQTFISIEKCLYQQVDRLPRTHGMRRSHDP